MPFLSSLFIFIYIAPFYAKDKTTDREMSSKPIKIEYKLENISFTRQRQYKSEQNPKRI